MFGFGPFTKSRILLGPLVIVWISELAVVQKIFSPQNTFRLHKVYCLNRSIFHSRNHINNILVSHEQRAEICDKNVAFLSYLATHPPHPENNGHNSCVYAFQSS